MKVKNKTIIVTGGGNGMGREMVIALIEKGAKVIALDINEAMLLETKQLLDSIKQANLFTYVVNLAEKAMVETLAANIIEEHVHVDAIINNAGIIQPFVRINELNYEAINKVVNVNFWGTLYMIKTFLPHLLKRPEAHIVNISSMGGFIPVPGQGVYCATKAAIKMLTESLASELSKTNVKVTVVFPGAVATNISANSGVTIPQGKIANSQPKTANALSPVKAAQMIIEGMEKDKSRLFVGKDSRLLDIIYRISPKFATNLINKQMQYLLEG